MARPRYPSDEKRDRPFARIHLTTRTHPTYGHVFADPLWRGIVYGLWQVARAAFAGETQDTVTLPLADVEWITGAAGRHAVARLRKACKMMDYPLSILGADGERMEGKRGALAKRSPSVRTMRYRVEIRNLQRKQAPRSAIRRSTSKRKSNEEEEEHSGAPEARGAEGLAKYLADAIKRADPQAKVPADLTAWAKEAERMLRLDKRKPEQVRSAIDWLFGANLESEAQFVVLSMKSLRTKYDRMRQQARKERGGSGGSRNIRSAARRVAERHGVGPGGNAREARAVRSDAGQLPSGDQSGCGADAGDVSGDDG